MKSITKTLLLVLAVTTTIFAQKKDLTLMTLLTDDSLNGSSIDSPYLLNDDNFTFLDKGEFYEKGDLCKYNIKSKEVSVLLSLKDYKEASGDKSASIAWYSFSSDEKFVVITDYLHPRYSKPGGMVVIFNVEDSSFTTIKEDDSSIWNPTVSPDSKKISYVYKNNIYVYDIEEKNTNQITDDGTDLIINGQFDWVYQEELKCVNGMRWSPDCSRLVYWKFDQSFLPMVKIAKWDSLYFNFLDLPYPKVGSKNSGMWIYSHNFDDNSTKQINIKDEEEFYIPRIMFTKNSDEILVQKTNRIQNKLELIKYNVKNDEYKTIISEESNTGWVDVVDGINFIDDERFTWVSEKSGYRHAYVYNTEGEELKHVDIGNWVIDEILGLYEGNIIFSANTGDVKSKNIFMAEEEGSSVTRLSHKDGTHEVTYSTGKPYFIDSYSNSTTPPGIFVNLFGEEEEFPLFVKDEDPFEKFDLPETQYFSFKNSNGDKINASLTKPSDYDPTKQYPVLIYNYSGPGSQMLHEKWPRFLEKWNWLMVNKGLLLLRIDGRGTEGRGTEFKHSIYKKLGTSEIEDMAEAVKYLVDEGIADPERVGIWGWSYGGYATLMSLAKYSDVYKMGIAVAPVTDWRYYDNAYTERFMSLPQFNESGYDEASVMKYAGGIESDLLLVHGTADDNVHFQNSVVLIKKLIDNRKQFRTFIYPESNHSLRGGSSSAMLHLFSMMTEYIEEKLLYEE